MSNIVLFIFEGAKTEPLITQNLSQFFINEPNKTLLKASYGFNIYKLYEALEEEPGLDVHGVVVEELERRESRAKLDPKQLTSGDVIPSELIFDKQKEKHIPHQEVAVLSAFPLMLHYHYGDKLTELFTQP